MPCWVRGGLAAGGLGEWLISFGGVGDFLGYALNTSTTGFDPSGGGRVRAVIGSAGRVFGGFCGISFVQNRLRRELTKGQPATIHRYTLYSVHLKVRLAAT